MTLRGFLQNARLPVIQAPMAGASTPKMAISASNCGVLGSIGCGMMQPNALKSAIRETKAGTERPFNVNLFVTDNQEGYNVDSVRDRLAWLYDYYTEMGLDSPRPSTFAPKFEEQFEALLEAQPPIASFVFGGIDIARVIGAATTPTEAEYWQRVGADGIVLQGIEAGGHRCSFLDPENPGEPLSELLKASRHLHTPLIAAGGIMNGRDVRVALRQGADCAQLGTAFLTTEESPVPASYRESLIAAHNDDTTLTKAFSGRWARGIRNRFTDMAGVQFTAPYPVQNALTQPLRSNAATHHRSDELSLWAGMGVGFVRDSPSTPHLIDKLQREYDGYNI
ncbi:hypothetical protein E3P91_04050 [Wallemia ichthyophaga]|nr:hypothetical protein E3P91_04050 [Wallemia ichthyophaga]TIA78728.1 hypothetical protein E3P98_03698 [Wallemia ichthyophaga]TIB58106.1 hypothetical protein E3P78_04032 [Wallemia ichthyophaga]